MRITKHSAERADERMGLSLTPFIKLAEKALKEGIKHSDSCGRFKKYIDGLYLSYRTANNIRIYGEFIYLFSNETLVTVLHLPNNFKNIVKSIKSKKTLP